MYGDRSEVEEEWLRWILPPEPLHRIGRQLVHNALVHPVRSVKAQELPAVRSLAEWFDTAGPKADRFPVSNVDASGIPVILWHAKVVIEADLQGARIEWLGEVGPSGPVAEVPFPDRCCAIPDRLEQ